MPSGTTSSDPRDQPGRSETTQLTGPGTDEARSAVDRAREYLESEVRAARAAAIATGADPGAVTVDLEQRLRRIRRMLADEEGRPSSPGSG